MTYLADQSSASRWIRERWNGSNGGPIQTVALLAKNGGYFEVPHLLLCYLDYLAGLATGKGPRRVFTDTCDFIRDYFPPSYSPLASWLVYQFRHGLAHQYAPKAIRCASGIIVGWYLDLPQDLAGNHTRILKEPQTGNVHIRLHAETFLSDFKSAVNSFAESIAKSPSLFHKVQAGLQAYESPEEITFIKKKPYLTSADKQWLETEVARAAAC